MRTDGFTLLEVVIVLLIVGLLATLVGPQLFGRADDARQARAAADLAGFMHALERHRLDTGAYPTTEQGLAALAPKYLDVLPDDPWGRPYVYFVAAGGRPTMRSFGADGLEGGSGADADVVPEPLP
jgi:general secretion pathway protein G